MKKMLSVGILLVAFGCSDEKNTSNTDSVVYAHFKWQNPSAVPVCIINRSDVSTELFNDVKEHVIKDYSTKTGITFVGWGDCTLRDKEAKVIRVTFHRVHNWSDKKIQAGGGLSMVGSTFFACDKNCQGGTMRLDVGSEGKYPPVGFWGRDFAIKQTRATAVHEFGHAMGLMHEHERTDAPGCQDIDQKVTNGDTYVYVGAFDKDSIMNYCNNNQLTSLSKGDVGGLKYLYPQIGNAGTPKPSTKPADLLTFGPFGHNEKRVLTTLADNGKYVNFLLNVDLEYDPECGYDYAIVEDAAGWKSSKKCGKTGWNLTNLVTPVKVMFFSDHGVASKSVQISKITYSESNAAASEPREQDAPSVEYE